MKLEYSPYKLNKPNLLYGQIDRTNWRGTPSFLFYDAYIFFYKFPVLRCVLWRGAETSATWTLLHRLQDACIIHRSIFPYSFFLLFSPSRSTPLLIFPLTPWFLASLLCLQYFSKLVIVLYLYMLRLEILNIPGIGKTIVDFIVTKAVDDWV